MKKKKLLGFLALSVFFLAGCIQTKDEYTINPDGTGKVIHEAVLQAMDLGFNPSESQSDPERKAKKMVKEELEKSKGIEAWSDVTWEAQDGNKVKFQGTAYFQDIEKVKFHNAGVTFSLLNQISLKIDQEELVLTIESEEKDKTSKLEEKVDLDEEQIQQKISLAREQLEKTKMMMAAGLSSMKIEKIFHIPGKRLSSSNFQVLDNNGIAFSLSGEKITAMMDSYIESDEWMREDILNGRDPLKDGPENANKINEILLGEASPVEATYYDVKEPLFDYAAEIAEAKKQMQSINESLGVMTSKKVDPSLSGKFRVGGIRIVFESDYDNGVRPFNYDKGLTLSIIGQLPQKALKIKEGEVTVAMTDNGQDLLSEKEWDRKISFANLGKDTVTAIFDVKLKMPNKNARSIESLEGKLIYVTAGEEKEVDLGITDFAEQSKGMMYDAVIERIGDSQWSSGKQQMDLKLDLPVDKVKEIKIFDENGISIEFSKGYSSFNDVVTYNITKDEGMFPSSGKIKIVVFEGLEQYELSFVLNDIVLPKR